MSRTTTLAWLGIVVATALAPMGCGGSTQGNINYVRMTASDPAIDVRDPNDLAWERDRLGAMAVDAPDREALRDVLADASLSRIDLLLNAGDYNRASDELLELLGLWQKDPATLGAQLGRAAPTLTRATAVLGQHGMTNGALVAHIALGIIVPADRAKHDAEITEILQFLDDLGMTERGPAAIGRGPIVALEPIARYFPSRQLVDTVVARIATRQATFSDFLATNGSSLELVQGHADVLTSGRRIVALLAIANRANEISPTLSQFRGIGVPPALQRHAREASQSAQAWLELCADLADDNQGFPVDLRGAMAATANAPGELANSPFVLRAHANFAAAAGFPLQALASVDAALRDNPADGASLDLAIGLRSELIEWLGNHERASAAAAQRAAGEAALHAPELRGTSAHQMASWQATLDLAWGRSLMAQGRIDDAQRALATSLKRKPSFGADKALGRIALSADHPAQASTHFVAALEQATTPDDRARALRLAGDAAFSGGKKDEALHRWIESLSTWASLGGPSEERTRDDEAERLLESARCLWQLGESDKAFELVAVVTSLVPDSSERVTEAVRFLLAVHAPLDAALAFEQLLGSLDATADQKTALALWLAADARQRAATLIPRASAWLAEQPPSTWLGTIAAAATGRMPWAEVVAQTPLQQMQLAYYRALLDDPLDSSQARRRLAEVLAANYILSHEFDDARARLRPTQARPSSP